MREHLKKRVQEEEKEIRRHRQTIARLELTLTDMDRIEECSGRYTLKSFPEAYILDTCQDIYEGLRQWFSMSSEVSGLDMTYFYNSFPSEMVSWRAGELSCWYIKAWSRLSASSLIFQATRLQNLYPVFIP